MTHERTPGWGLVHVADAFGHLGEAIRLRRMFESDAAGHYPAAATAAEASGMIYGRALIELFTTRVRVQGDDRHDNIYLEQLGVTLPEDSVIDADLKQIKLMIDRNLTHLTWYRDPTHPER